MVEWIFFSSILFASLSTNFSMALRFFAMILNTTYIGNYSKQQIQCTKNSSEMCFIKYSVCWQ